MIGKMLVFRLGYMEAYDGVGEISSGGKYVEENQEGGEMWNFQNEGGYCYGYVMTRNFSGIDLRKLAKDGFIHSEMDGVTVVFIAKRPKVGQVVVGWYREAEVFHKRYENRKGPIGQKDWLNIDYVCRADSENAYLLPEKERTFRVPTVAQRGEGFQGQSNIWYCQQKNSAVTSFLLSLKNYIEGYGSDHVVAKIRKGARGWGKQPAKELMLAIEKAAMDAVAKYFHGYEIEWCHKDNRGWDLEARKGKKCLYIEVKGHLASTINFELTPNEYENMKSLHTRYRVCVVRNALVSDLVEVFTPRLSDNGDWMLVSTQTIIRLRERVGARASEIK